MSAADQQARSTQPAGSTQATFEGLEISQRMTAKLPKTKDNDPTALDVISDLINPAEEEKASVYMKGHIDQDIINETFLMNA